MDVTNRLRNSLIRRLERLSADKLSEINNLLGQIESQTKTKDKTLKLAGTWKDLDDDFFTEMTENLHDNRARDRQIN